MESDRENEESQDDSLEERKLAEQGNTDAKLIVPKDNEPSDDDPEEPEDERT